MLKLIKNKLLTNYRYSLMISKLIFIAFIYLKSGEAWPVTELHYYISNNNCEQTSDDRANTYEAIHTQLKQELDNSTKLNTNNIDNKCDLNKQFNIGLDKCQKALNSISIHSELHTYLDDFRDSKLKNQLRTFLFDLKLNNKNEDDKNFLKELLMDEKQLMSLLILNHPTFKTKDFSEQTKIKNEIENSISKFQSTLDNNCNIQSLSINRKELEGMQYQDNSHLQDLKHFKSMCDIALTKLGFTLTALDTLDGLPALSAGLTVLGTANFLLGYYIRQAKIKLANKRADFSKKIMQNSQTTSPAIESNKGELLELTGNTSDLFSILTNPGNNLETIFSIPGNVSLLLGAYFLDETLGELSKNPHSDTHIQIFEITENYYLKILEKTYQYNRRKLMKELEGLNVCRNYTPQIIIADRIIDKFCKILSPIDQEHNQYIDKIKSTIHMNIEDYFKFLQKRTKEIEEEYQTLVTQKELEANQREKIAKIYQAILELRKKREKEKSEPLNVLDQTLGKKPPVETSFWNLPYLSEDRKNTLMKDERINTYVGKLNEAIKIGKFEGMTKEALQGTTLSGTDYCIWDDQELRSLNIQFCCSYLNTQRYIPNPKRCRYEANKTTD